MVDIFVSQKEKGSAINALNRTSDDSAKELGNAERTGASIRWLQVPAQWPVSPGWQPGTVDVLAATLDVGFEALGCLRATLAATELRRAGRFHFPHHRDRFIAARGLLRTVLGRCLGADARNLEFAYGHHGKPELAGAFSDCELRFNLAHCENLALIALTRGRKIGVDLERIRILPGMGELVDRFFSPRENALFQTLPAAQQTEAFFNLWTRKEAWLKATGEGISRYLGQVEVTFSPGETAQLVSLPGCIAPQGQWSLCDLRPTKEFAAAIAVEGQIGMLHRWDWDLAEEKNEQNARGL